MTSTGSVQAHSGKTSAPAAALHARCLAHVLARIADTPVGEQPFHHMFIDRIFPDDVYDALRAHMLGFKHSDRVQDRLQDNPAFANRRYNLFDSADGIVACVRAVFTDPRVKTAMLGRFYVDPTRTLADVLSIHHEFEYTFTQAGRFQNIHIDIPAKYLSFVFYIPEHPAPPAEEARNATILYDRALQPHYLARFRANAVCVFAPHFHSYHGFSSTIDRDVMVMFYVDPDAVQRWRDIRQQRPEAPPFNDLLDEIEAKLRAHPLIEFGADEGRLLAERAACRVNAPQGRVLV